MRYSPSLQTSVKEAWIKYDGRLPPDRNANSVSVVGIDDHIIVMSRCDD